TSAAKGYWGELLTNSRPAFPKVGRKIRAGEWYKRWTSALTSVRSGSTGKGHAGCDVSSCARLVSRRWAVIKPPNPVARIRLCGRSRVRRVRCSAARDGVQQSLQRSPHAEPPGGLHSTHLPTACTRRRREAAPSRPDVAPQSE